MRSLCTISFILFLGSCIEPAFAQTVDCSDPENSGNLQCLGSCEDVFTNTPGLTHATVECVRSIFTKFTSGGVFEEVMHGMDNAIKAVFMLAIVVFGMKIALQGSQNMQGDFLVELLKHVFIATFVVAGVQMGEHSNGLEWLHNLIMDTSQALSNVMGSAINSQLPESCQEAVKDNPSVWLRVDCMILAYLGYDLTTVGQLLSDPKALFGINLSGAVLMEIPRMQFFTPHGVIIFGLVGLGLIVMLITFGTALFVYIAAIIAVTFLLMLGPAILPLMLFTRTKRIVNIWFFQLISFTLQPAILVAYLAFSVSALNIVIEGDTANPDSGVTGINQFLRNASFTEPTNTCLFKAQTNEQRNVFIPIPIDNQEVLKRDPSKKSECLPVRYMVFEMTDYAVFIIHLIGALVMMILIMTFMFNVISFAGALTGASMGIASNLADYMPGKGSASAALNSAISSMGGGRVK